MSEPQKQYICPGCAQAKVVKSYPALFPKEQHCLYCGVLDPMVQPRPAHAGEIRFFGRYSWQCLACFATGSHPLGHIVPSYHAIGEQNALEPMP